MIAGASVGGLLCCCGLFFGGFLARKKLMNKKKSDRVYDEEPSPTDRTANTNLFGGMPQPQSPPGGAMIKSPLHGSDKLLRKRAGTMRTNDTTPTSKGDDEESMNDGLFVTPSSDGRSSFIATMSVRT